MIDSFSKQKVVSFLIAVLITIGLVVYLVVPKAEIQIKQLSKLKTIRQAVTLVDTNSLEVESLDFRLLSQKVYPAKLVQGVFASLDDALAAQDVLFRDNYSSFPELGELTIDTKNYSSFLFFSKAEIEAFVWQDYLGLDYNFKESTSNHTFLWEDRYAVWNVVDYDPQQHVAELVLELKVPYFKPLDQALLSQQIKGLSLEDAQEILMMLINVSSVEIKLWPDFISDLPLLTARHYYLVDIN